MSRSKIVPISAYKENFDGPYCVKADGSEIYLPCRILAVHEGCICLIVDGEKGMKLVLQSSVRCGQWQAEKMELFVNEYMHGIDAKVHFTREAADNAADMTRIACRRFVEAAPRKKRRAG